MENIISIKNVNFSYKDRNQVILKNVNFDINEGDFVGLIGNNGVGKSTLVKVILGLIKPDSGKVKIFSKDISELKHKKVLGYMPQNVTALLSGFPATVKEIIKSSFFAGNKLLRLKKTDCEEKIYQALKLTQMQDYAECMVGELSGGQQQRVMISKVLVNEPRLLILDEPTVGLDSESVKSLYELLKRLNIDKNLTILMVTHDINGIKKYANRILNLSNEGITEKENK